MTVVEKARATTWVLVVNWPLNRCECIVLAAAHAD